jgi:putative thioredoxin
MGPSGAVPGKSAHIKEGNDRTFMTDVVEASKTQPVVVDFWAPWCGPCRTLIPILERTIAARNGAVKLVKINVDENPGVAGQMGVRSIPAVFAFAGGRPVDGFMGALPEGQVNSFLDKLVSGGVAQGPSAAEIEAVLEEAGQAFRQGDLGQAAQLYAALAEALPDHVGAVAGLARCFLAAGQPDEARQTVESLPEKLRSDPEVKSVLMAIALTSEAPAAPDALAGQIAAVNADPENAAARFALAEALAGAQRNGEAIAHLLTLLGKDLNAQDGAAKALLLKVFEAEGPKSEHTIAGRRRLSALMFA